MEIFVLENQFNHEDQQGKPVPIGVYSTYAKAETAANQMALDYGNCVTFRITQLTLDKIY